MVTDELEGYKLDRGFQVYFSGYPHASAELAGSKLSLGRFEPGALICCGGGDFHKIHRDDVLDMVTASFPNFSDKFRLALWALKLRGTSRQAIWEAQDESFERHLERRSFSCDLIDAFFRPFFGGVFLDKSLSFSANLALFVAKVIGSGNTCVPSGGAQDVPRALAAELPGDRIRTNCPVERIEPGHVLLASGERVESEATILATSPSAARGLGIDVPGVAEGKSSTTVWFAAEQSTVRRPLLVLNGTGKGFVNHVAPMSLVSPSSAPSGHLMCATIVGESSLSDPDLAQTVRLELADWFPRADVRSWRALRVDRIKHAQIDQQPGFRSTRPSNETNLRKVYFASDATEYAGLDGAVLSGQKCAAAVMEDLR